jgi:uncharacterized protein YndB with AHSA1/START domain
MDQVTTAPISQEYSVAHATFSVERIYAQSPARVFAAFADEATKRRWFAEGEGWEIFEYSLDFRVGGAETSRFRYGDGPEVRLDAVVQDIIPDRRIVLVYRMAMGPKPLSVSLATMELAPSGKGTRLTYTEQGAYFDTSIASAKGHEEGCRGLFERLAAELQSSR